MKTKLICLLSLAVLFTYCSEDNIEVTLKTSGGLKVKVVDNDENAIADTKVKLYDASVSNDYIDALMTNTSGIVDFGELLSGTYTLELDTPKVDGIKYIPVKIVQVISGYNKEAVINVQEYVGSLNITVNKATYLGGGPFVGLNVIIVPSDKYSASYTIDNLISRAEFSGETNSQGFIAFSIPSSRSFRLIVYNDLKYRKNALTTVDLEKDELKKLTYSLDTSLVVMK